MDRALGVSDVHTALLLRCSPTAHIDMLRWKTCPAFVLRPLALCRVDILHRVSNTKGTTGILSRTYPTSPDYPEVISRSHATVSRWLGELERT